MHVHVHVHVMLPSTSAMAAHPATLPATPRLPPPRPHSAKAAVWPTAAWAKVTARPRSLARDRAAASTTVSTTASIAEGGGPPLTRARRVSRENMLSMPRIDSVGLSLADLDVASAPAAAGPRASPVPPALKATGVGSPVPPDATATATGSRGSPTPELRPAPPAAAPVEVPAAAPAPAPAAEAAAPSKRLSFVEAAARRAVDATRAAGAAGVAELLGNGGACGFAIGARVEVDYDDEGWFGGVVQAGCIRGAYGMHTATGGMRAVTGLGAHGCRRASCRTRRPCTWSSSTAAAWQRTCAAARCAPLGRGDGDGRNTQRSGRRAAAARVVVRLKA